MLASTNRAMRRLELQGIVMLPHFNVRKEVNEATGENGGADGVEVICAAHPRLVSVQCLGWGLEDEMNDDDCDSAGGQIKEETARQRYLFPFQEHEQDCKNSA